MAGHAPVGVLPSGQDWGGERPGAWAVPGCESAYGDLRHCVQLAKAPGALARLALARRCLAGGTPKSPSSRHQGHRQTVCPVMLWAALPSSHVPFLPCLGGSQNGILRLVEEIVYRSTLDHSGSKRRVTWYGVASGLSEARCVPGGEVCLVHRPDFVQWEVSSGRCGPEHLSQFYRSPRAPPTGKLFPISQRVGPGAAVALKSAGTGRERKCSFVMSRESSVDPAAPSRLGSEEAAEQQPQGQVRRRQAGPQGHQPAGEAGGAVALGGRREAQQDRPGTGAVHVHCGHHP
ncbi:uncharacterized protein LOC120616110 [Pteropus medius]|uniref:uncharacterized protein LOC120616110 n=1 Tax=Pteropus vampyrus TaxID=132908 RepID=UPI00196A4D03|nr:uncharacterized protein LOC120616110 [Pteropus giganteus]